MDTGTCQTGSDRDAHTFLYVIKNGEMDDKSGVMRQNYGTPRLIGRDVPVRPPLNVTNL